MSLYPSDNLYPNNALFPDQPALIEFNFPFGYNTISIENNKQESISNSPNGNTISGSPRNNIGTSK